jgi:N-acetylneuraminate synthase|tara:strand:- start:106 stop:1140 length:1035 start_codon:yes stop_codon:yes gene_type:complete
MKTIRLRDATVIGAFNKPYIVAEINTSHFGNMEMAKEMIKKAREAGCDCVKFQSWSAETLYSKTYYDENPIAKRMFNKFAFSEVELAEAAEYSKKCGIAFSSTPYSRAEVDFLLEKCNVPYIKIASMDLNNYSFLDYIARSGAPIVLSTGMGELEEIHRAVEIIEKAENKNICLLHCISIYPSETSTIRLRNISGLRKEFPDYPIGFSDHSIGTGMASAALALGACMIEKHFTLDRTKIGMDNQMAIEPEEMALLVRNCHNVQIALGDTKRIVLSAEIEQRKKMRRSIIATKDLKAGTKLTADDLDVKRPGTGLSPDKISELVGKTLLRDIEGDTLITEADISE